MSFGLSKKTQQMICSVFQRHPGIDKAIIYGSRANGSYRNGSDIDLTLLATDLTSEQLDIVLMELDELNSPYMMDVSLYEQLQSIELKSHIDRVGRCFYEK